MRLRSPLTVFIAILVLALFALIASRVLHFIRLFGAHSGPLLTQEEVEAAYNGAGHKSRQEYVPRILHQIFHNWADPGNETLPTDWGVTRKTCIDANPDFEYRLWTDSTSLEFIASHYPWFLKTYKGYKLPVQRVDSLKYFLMLKFGGIYIDMDNGCSRDFKPLLYYPAWVIDGGHGTLSNDVLAARPGHPYWKMMTSSLPAWDINWLFPLFTVHYTSGQWFETAIWEQYHAQFPGGEPGDEADKAYRILNDGREGAPRRLFFTHGRGGTWDTWDKTWFELFGNKLIPWLGAHAVLVVILLGAVVVGLYMWRWRRRRTGAAMKGYTTLPTELEAV